MKLLLKYFLDQYKIQEMCDKAVDAYLITLAFGPDQLVIKKML